MHILDIFTFFMVYYFDFIMSKVIYLNLVTDFIFGIEKNVLTGLLFSSSILTIFDRPFYIARDHAPVSVHMIPNV